MNQVEQSLRSPNTAARMGHRLAASAGAFLLRLAKAARQCELAELSGSQLRDAGIDPSLAGRGRAAAASAATLRRLESLSAG